MENASQLKRRRLFIAGLFLFSIGGIMCVYLAARIADARINGVFSTNVTDAPTNRFEKFSCPLIMNQGETKEVRAALLNDTGQPLEYSLSLSTSGFSVAPTASLRLTINSEQAVDLTWRVTALHSGRSALAVEAISTQDADLAGQFHPWPTSFREGCGILIVKSPLAGVQTLLLPLVALLSGAVLTLAALYWEAGCSTCWASPWADCSARW